ncbi:hypothetical protein Q7P35_000248 [Cladosporium inversicolor]
MDPPPAPQQLSKKNKLTRDRRLCWMTSPPCDLDGTSSIKDTIPIVFRATRVRTPPNHKSSTTLTHTHSLAQLQISHLASLQSTILLAPADALRSRLQNALNAAGHRRPDACQHCIANKAAYKTKRLCLPETFSTSILETAEHSATQDTSQCPEADPTDTWHADAASTCL